MKGFKAQGKLEVIHKHGQPYGIRDAGGYLLFFPRVTKYTGQEQRYVDEVHNVYVLAAKIMEALSDNEQNI
jgi:hypothetical protein